MADNSTGLMSKAAPQTQPKSLFQQISGNLQQMAAPQTPGILGSTALIEGISSAATGKGAGPKEGPSRDVQQELAVVDQVKQGQQAIARDQQLTQLAMQQADQQLQNESTFSERKLDEDELNRLDAFNRTQQRILNEYTVGQRQLDFNKDKAKLEQLGFSMRLGNERYIQNLQSEAQKARLSDAAKFEEELYRTVFADETELLQSSLDFRALLAADARTFSDEMANMDLDYAIRIAEAENKSASERMAWSGLGGLVSAGVKGYYDYNTRKEKE